MDQEILSFLLWCAVCSTYCISPLGAQFTKMAANGSEKATSWHATNSLEQTRFSCWCL